MVTINYCVYYGTNSVVFGEVLLIILLSSDQVMLYCGLENAVQLNITDNPSYCNTLLGGVIIVGGAKDKLIFN